MPKERKISAPSSPSGDDLRSKLIIESALDAIITTDADGRVTEWNPAAEQLFGYTHEQAMGAEMSALIVPPRLRERHRTAFRGAATGGKSGVLLRRVEMTAMRADGGEFSVELTVSATSVAGRAYFMAFIRDLSAWRQAQEAERKLRELSETSLTVQARDRAEAESERQRFQHLFEHSPVATWAEDWSELPVWMDGLRAAGVKCLETHLAANPGELRRALGLVRILDVNQAAVVQNVAHSKEHLLQNLAALFTDAAYEEFARELIALWRGEKRYHYEYESRVRRLDGQRLHLIVRIDVPLAGGVPDFSRVILTGTDITERKNAEERLRACIENTPNVAVQWFDEKGRVVFWNPASETMFGWRAVEAVGRTLDELIHTPEEFAGFLEVLAEIRRTGKTVGPAEYSFRRRDGGTGVCLSTLFALPDEGGEPRFVCMDVDLTERRNIEAQLRQSQKMEAVGQLAGGVAHDFNNLLTVISGHTELLAMDLGVATQHGLAIEEIRKATDRAASLTRQLLAFSRQQVVAPRLLNLNTVVGNTERMLRRLIGEDIRLATILAPALHAVRADSGQIEQVLMNLAINARDAMPGGGEMTICTTNVALDEEFAKAHPEVQPGAYVRLRVSDTGTGMSDEVRARIFEPFFTTKGLGKGTGLGLAVVHGIVQQSGGHIDVESIAGVGTRFSIFLPAIEDRPAVEPHHSTPDAPRGHETILLVEDEEIVRKLATRALEMLGYQLLVAANGTEAIRLAENCGREIHLLVADVVLPDIGGRAVAETICARLPAVRVLYCSGYTDDTVIRHGIEHASVHFLQKPYTVRQLAAKVREVLDGK